MKKKKISVRGIELRLVTDNRENNNDGQPTTFHLSRWQNSKGRVTATACGRKDFSGMVWNFYNWIASNKDVMCAKCLERVEVKLSLFGKDKPGPQA